MHTFYVNNIKKGLSQEQLKQIKKVLRIKNGEKIILFDNINYYNCLWNNQKETFDILDQNSIDNEQNNISFYIPLLKNSNTKLVIQKLTEIGVKSIFPFYSKRTVIKEKKDKHEKYLKIIIEASEQSRNFSLPKLNPVVKLSDIDFKEYECVIVAYENERTINIANAIKKINNKTKLACIIGPEGGFDQDEISELMTKNNVKIVSLGKNILRAETAVIYLAAIVKNKIEQENDEVY
jgi:16S rRNA (uracil1498-N3)-methyltransferase